MPISCTWSNFSPNQHTNEHNHAKQSYQIWRKNFQALPSNHILRVGSFFLAAPCTNVAVFQFRRKVVPHRWCRWALAVLIKPKRTVQERGTTTSPWSADRSRARAPTVWTGTRTNAKCILLLWLPRGIWCLIVRLLSYAKIKKWNKEVSNKLLAITWQVSGNVANL